jgi:DNA invertase Pin-like site-specific DNA recombinase
MKSIGLTADRRNGNQGFRGALIWKCDKFIMATMTITYAWNKRALFVVTKTFLSVKAPGNAYRHGGFDWMARLGYARVSTVDQNLDLQKDALRKAGCERIFEDYGVSGSERKRDGLSSVLRSLRKGDVLVVWRLDRLGRSVGHLVQLVTRLQKRQIGFHSVTENIETESAGGRMVFHVLAAMAEFERSIIRERTVAGIAAARARGQQHGRKRSLTDEQCVAAYRDIDSGAPWEIVASRFWVHQRTLKRCITRVCGNLPGASVNSEISGANSIA